MNLIMTMAGEGSRYKGIFNNPKPLIELQNQPLFFWSTNSVLKYYNINNLIFVILKKHNDKFDLAKKIYNTYPNSKVVILDKILDGPLKSALKAVELIDNDEMLMINDCDHIFFSNYLYLNKDSLNFDSALCTFQSSHPNYSYALFKDNNLIDIKEKKVISNSAICGAYLFKNKNIFINNAIKFISNNLKNEYFMSDVYSELLKNKNKIINIPLDIHLSFGTPDEYNQVSKSPIFNLFK